MMVRVDFYVITEETLLARLQFACRLIEKAHQQNHRLYVHHQNENDAKLLDNLLWTYRDDSFIPHALYDETFKTPPPIQIGFNVTPDNHRDILINMSEDVPDFYVQFSRVLEIVSSDTKVQASGRERYRFYREKGCDIQTHKI